MEAHNVGFLGNIPILNMFFAKPSGSRMILVGSDKKVTHLSFENNFLPPDEVAGMEYYATGEFDSYSETLTIELPNSIQTTIN